MEWHLSKDVVGAIAEIEQSSDRAVAIVVAALVERPLTDALKQMLHHNDKITNELFRSTGAFGDFGVKIHLAFLIGLLSKVAHRELVTIKDIRNAFAHKIEINSFDHPRISAFCANLQLHATANFTMTKLSKGGVRSLVYTPEKPTSNPKERYIASCKLHIAILSMQIPDGPTMRDPLF